MRTRTVYKGYVITEEDGTVIWYRGFTPFKAHSIELAKRQIDRHEISQD